MVFWKCPNLSIGKTRAGGGLCDLQVTDVLNCDSFLCNNPRERLRLMGGRGRFNAHVPWGDLSFAFQITVQT